MTAEGSEEIDGVGDEEVAAVAGLVPEMPNLRAESADSFAQAVRTLVEKRAQAGWLDEGDANLAVFVLVDYPRQLGEEHDGVPFVDPIAQGIPLLGKLFFSSPDASHGYVIPIPVGENEYREWLKDNRLGSYPVVAVYRETKLMVTRRLGVDDQTWVDAIRDQEPTATVEELMEALDHFHRRQVLTPSNRPGGIWKHGSAHSYIPSECPEKSIQSQLKFALNFWFRGVVWAESEDKTNIGRIDVRLLISGARADRSLTYWVILELKVIKSFTNSGTPVGNSSNLNSIVKGVRQTGSYRANRKVEEGMLEIYDLRKDKSKDLITHENVSKALNQYCPPLRVNVWPLFGSSVDARNAGFTGA